MTPRDAEKLDMLGEYLSGVSFNRVGLKRGLTSEEVRDRLRPRMRHMLRLAGELALDEPPPLVFTDNRPSCHLPAPPANVRRPCGRCGRPFRQTAKRRFMCRECFATARE